MLHCTFVQTGSLDKEKNNHWDFNFQPPESFSDAEGNLISDITALICASCHRGEWCARGV